MKRWWCVLPLCWSACDSPDVAVRNGLNEDAHSAIYFPIEADAVAAEQKRGACKDGDTCAALTGSHQCAPDDVANGFARPFCQADSPQATKTTLEGSYSCTQCHGTQDTFETQRCVECHIALPIVAPGHPQLPGGAKSPDHRHQHVGGFAVDTPICASCHAENFDTNRDGAFDRNDASPRNADRVAGHVFSLRPGSAHYRVACWDCHVEQRTDKVWAVDFTTTTAVRCDGCHRDADMQTLHQDDAGAPLTQTTAAGAVAFGAKCIACHSDGVVAPHSD